VKGTTPGVSKGKGACRATPEEVNSFKVINEKLFQLRILQSYYF
jgi:hypothetical protein